MPFEKYKPQGLFSEFYGILLLGLQGSCNIVETLTKENIDVLDVKNGNRKLIFSLFQCSDSTNSYSGIQDKGIHIHCLRQKCSIKRDIKFPVAIHDVWDVSVLFVQAH